MYGQEPDHAGDHRYGQAAKRKGERKIDSAITVQFAEYLPAIAAEGLTPAPPPPPENCWPEFDYLWEEAGDDEVELPPEASEPRVFATESFSDAEAYADNYPQPAVLRIERNFSAWDRGKTDHPYLYTSKAVAPRENRGLVGEGLGTHQNVRRQSNDDSARLSDTFRVTRAGGIGMPDACPCLTRVPDEFGGSVPPCAAVGASGIAGTRCVRRDGHALADASLERGIPFTPARQPGKVARMDNFPVPSGLHGRIPFDEILFGDTETTGLAPYGMLEGIPTGDPLGPDRLCSVAFHPAPAVCGRLASRRIDRFRLRSRTSRSGACCQGQRVPLVWRRLTGSSGENRPRRRQADLPCTPRGCCSSSGMRPFVSTMPSSMSRCSTPNSQHAGLPRIAVPVLCTKKAFSEKRGFGRPNHYLAGTSLNALCDLLGVDRSERIGPDGKEFHGAMADARMGAACFALLEPSGWMLGEDPEVLPHRVRTLAAQPVL